MGGALVAGWCAKGFGARIVVIEPQPSKQLRALKRKYQLRVNPRDFDSLRERPEAVVMAVKPQIFGETARQYAALANGAVVLSIAAGVSQATMSQIFGREAAIVRAMPNLPALVGKGISAAVANQHVSPGQKRLADNLLAAAGEVVWVDQEAFLDPVTAVSGSGPAYVFLLVECLARAAKDVGLPADLADRLARATIVGAGALLEQSVEPASSLREGVTSPGGTTAAALGILMGQGQPGLDELIHRAVAAATARAKELGR
jgi:pyrroline-5-carboxylate reductase